MRSKIVTVLLMGAVALLLAVNPAVGHAAGLITGKQIKNNSVTGKDIKDKSLTAQDFSGSVTGPQGPAGPTGPVGPAGANATALWAVVSAPASGAVLERGSGVASVGRIAAGFYTVTFTRSIANCAAVATPGSGSAGSSPSLHATVEQFNVGQPTVLEVKLFNDAGANVDGSASIGFHLAVFCP